MNKVAVLVSQTNYYKNYLSVRKESLTARENLKVTDITVFCKGSVFLFLFIILLCLPIKFVNHFLCYLYLVFNHFDLIICFSTFGCSILSLYFGVFQFDVLHNQTIASTRGVADVRFY